MALDEAHGQVELAVVLAGLVDRDHVRVVERGGETRLAQEARPEALVLGELRGDQLQRHRPLQRQVGGPVDHGKEFVYRFPVPEEGWNESAPAQRLPGNAPRRQD